MTRLVFFILISSLPFLAPGQSYIKSSSKKLKKCYAKAAQEAQNKNYKKALEHCNKILKKEPDNVDALLRRGSYYYSIKDFLSAEADFSGALNLNPTYDGRIYYTLALSQYEQKKYADAYINMQHFLDSQDGSKKQKLRAEAILNQASFAAEAIKNPVEFNPIRLSENINTLNLEYYPSLTADNKQMIYLTNDGNIEDIYISKISEEGTYSKGEVFKAFNVRLGEGAHCISADGKTIVFTSCDSRNSAISNTYGSCDLFISYLQNGKWSLPENMGPEVNSRAMDTQPNLSPDGQTLYFSSKRNNKTGADIYKSKKLGSTWTDPERLSDRINTSRDDESPFLHPDGKTFYFRSNGRPGMGDFDIYYTRWDDLTQQWGEVKNIGYPINTDANDGALFINLEGTTAYYTSDRYSLDNNIKPNLDIYKFELYPEARPIPTTYVSGIVRDAISGIALQTEIKISSSDIMRSINTDETGKFLITLPAYTDYSFHVEKEGYIFVSNRFELKEVKNALEPFLLTIDMYPLPIEEEKPTEIVFDKPIVLKNILFETGSAILLEESNGEIQQLYNLLKTSPEIKVEIYGHTDNVGDENDNLKLSELRAQSVYNKLIKMGITSNRLSYKGFGEIKPISDNHSKEGRRLNRRTEFLIKSS